MKTINTILNIIAIAILIAALIGFGWLMWVIYTILDLFVDFYWWEFAILGVLIAFVAWRLWRILED